MKLYGIKNCNTVKKAMNFLKSKGLEYEFIDFKKEPPSESLIKTWEARFSGLPINKKGLTYRKFKKDFEGLKSVKDKRIFLKDHSSMIKRPILEKGNKTLFGFNESEYQKLC